jgi:acyl-CoA dehydrogenase
LRFFAMSSKLYAQQSVFDRIDQSVPLLGDESLLLSEVKRLCRREIGPNAAQYDREASYPQRSIDAINQLGLNQMFIPEDCGGAPMSYTAYLLAVREISKACASSGIIWATNFHGMKPLIDFGTQEQRQSLLPAIAQGGLGALAITEPDAGSDATGMKTIFRPEGDYIVVQGGKTFISNGDRAARLLVFGKWSEIDDPKAAISALIIEQGTPGLSVLKVEEKMGHRAAPTASIRFDECKVPRSHLLLEPGDGLKILFASLNKSRPSVAAHALGIARAAWELAVDYINQRKQSGRRIIEFQGIQFMLADLASELAFCESWLWHTARLVEQGATSFGIEASMLKMRASDLAMRMATEAVQLLGGYGYCNDYPAERLMRDAKITQIWEGTNQVHRQFIGRSFIDRHVLS